MAYELRWLEWRPQYPSEREKFHYKSVKTKAEGQKLLRDMKKAGRYIKFSTIEKVESNPRKPVVAPLFPIKSFEVKGYKGYAHPQKKRIIKATTFKAAADKYAGHSVWPGREHRSGEYIFASSEFNAIWVKEINENPRKYKRVRFKVPAALRRMRAGALHATIRPKANPPARGAKLIGTRLIYLEYSKAGMVHNCDAKCKAANHCWKHSSRRSTKACIWGLPDGSVLISL